MNTQAVIYARVSSSGSLEHRQNTDRQVKDLTDYASYKGNDLVKVFEEHISGAKKNSDRPALQQAIDHCKASAKDNSTILLCSELSRVGRSAFEVLETIKTLVDSGINLYLQKEQLTLLMIMVNHAYLHPLCLPHLLLVLNLKEITSNSD